MNSPFLSTHRLLLTPLSPIHIGCGVDYEPTNSVIDADRNFLYSFNLGLVGLLPQERRGLMTAVQNGVIEEINSFYARNIDIFRPWSSNIVPVSGKAVQKYRSMLSPKPQVKGGQKKTAQFAFQRLVFTRSDLWTTHPLSSGLPLFLIPELRAVSGNLRQPEVKCFAYK